MRGADREVRPTRLSVIAAPASSAHPIPIGKFTCYPICDGGLIHRSVALLGDVPGRAADWPEQVPVPSTPLLVDTGTLRVLIDTGGAALAATTGRLEERLASAGFSPADIGLILLSHAHPDHIGGLLRDDGAERFPAARVAMSRLDYDFWHSDEVRARVGTGTLYRNPQMEIMIAGFIDRCLPPVVDRLEWLDAGGEIVPGISAFPSPGHTPGHVCIAVASGGESLLFSGDVVIVPDQVAHPDWTSAFDLDRPRLEDTRRKLLDRAAADRSVLYGYHMVQSGHVERRGTEFVWTTD
jgi:glyoxylase-like metal-dependent hydrolase (beta-lactamase superfamily II)